MTKTVPLLKGQPCWMVVDWWHGQNEGQQPGVAAQEVRAGHGGKFIFQEGGVVL